jgi:hypothetical protein
VDEAYLLPELYELRIKGRSPKTGKNYLFDRDWSDKLISKIASGYQNLMDPPLLGLRKLEFSGSKK